MSHEDYTFALFQSKILNGREEKQSANSRVYSRKWIIQQDDVGILVEGPSQGNSCALSKTREEK
jgi:hypothetical protein